MKNSSLLGIWARMSSTPLLITRFLISTPTRRPSFSFVRGRIFWGKVGWWSRIHESFDYNIHLRIQTSTLFSRNSNSSPLCRSHRSVSFFQAMVQKVWLSFLRIYFIFRHSQALAALKAWSQWLAQLHNLSSREPAYQVVYFITSC